MIRLHCDDDPRFADWVAPERVPADLDALTDEEVGRELAYLLSSISEDCYCATWLCGLEDAGWAWAQHPGPWPVSWGMGEVSAECGAALARIRERLGGGWVEYGDSGVELLTADEWRARIPRGGL